VLIGPDDRRDAGNGRDAHQVDEIGLVEVTPVPPQERSQQVRPVPPLGPRQALDVLQPWSGLGMFEVDDVDVFTVEQPVPWLPVPVGGDCLRVSEPARASTWRRAISICEGSSNPGWARTTPAEQALHRRAGELLAGFHAAANWEHLFTSRR
jgi:hypothetical protein